MFFDNCTLSAFYLWDSPAYAKVILEPFKSAYFFYNFPLVSPFQNLQKCAILGSFPNPSELDSAGSFGGAVCAKIFSDDYILSAYYLWDSLVCARLILKPPNLAYFFDRFSLVPPFAKSPKLRVFCVFVKSVVAQFCGHFRRPSFHHNIFRWLDFKHILVMR